MTAPTLPTDQSPPAGTLVGSAAKDPHDSTAPTAPPINPERLTVDQLRGLNCAYCKDRLYRARSIGTVSVGPAVIAEDVELYVCAPVCRPEVERSPQAWCYFCHDPIAGEAPVSVGYRPAPSGPGRLLYADGKCRVAYRVIPLSDHPACTDGAIRYRDRQPFAPRSR